MTGKDLYSAINNIDDDLISGALDIKAPKKRMPLKGIISVAACFLVLFGVLIYTSNTNMPSHDLTDRIVVDSNAIVASVMVNFEGIITEVAEDGMSFRLDTGKWVEVTGDTEIGTPCTSEQAKAEMLFEPTFRVGNSVTGYTEDENADTIIAYAVYTNWNWSNPIK